MGVREYGCNLETTASNFETGLRCESYSPNVSGAGDVGRYPAEIEAKCRMLDFGMVCAIPLTLNHLRFLSQFFSSAQTYIMHASTNSYGLWKCIRY